MENKRNGDINAVMNEFINMFDEFVFCMFFATKGINMMGEKLAQDDPKEGHQTWIGSNLPDNPKSHARINTVECIKKCEKNGYFSNEIAKSLLCTMYSLWDEEYRHRIADVTGYEARYIECPLMGDLRKIRHCIIHQKSIIPDGGLQFESLGWQLPQGKLEITYNMFLEFNDEVRGERMKISGFSLSSAIKKLLPSMTNKERKDFDDFFKKRENRLNNVEWPGLEEFLHRIGHQKA